MATAHAQPNYIGVFWWLVVLTVLEVVVIFVPIPRIVIAASLVSMAVAKAALVAMYFMHLKFERLTLGMIALSPFILCLFLLLMLLPDTP